MEILKTKRSTPPRILIHGEGGTGKSTLASMAPNPIFINLEDGLAELDTSAFPKPTNFDQALQQLTHLYAEKHEFKTVVTDSLDWLEMLAAKQICADRDIKSLSEVAYGKGYEEAFSLIKRYYTGLNALYSEKNMAVIILAHSRIKTFQDPLGENYDRYQIKVRDNIAELFVEWCTLVGFLSPEIHVDITKEGLRDSKKAIYQNTVVLRCQRGNPAYVGKNRYDIDYDIPIGKDDGWDDLMKAIKGGK